MSRPHRGPRKLVTVRLPQEIVEDVDRLADEQGLPRTDVIVNAVYTMLGLDPWAKPTLPAREVQEELAV